MNSRMLSGVIALLCSPILFAADTAKPPEPGRLASASVEPPPVAVTHLRGLAVREERHDLRMRQLWIASVAAAITATSLDAATSWGKLESNSLLAGKNGTFGAKGVGIKAALVAGLVIPQVCLRRHKELRGVFSAGNLGEAGLFSVAAVHNLRVPPVKKE